ncbi:UNVERIFIED_CONTAM: hypothetical protein Sradi_2515400 [Sesamum radiatum]|uniref:Uncharacterized protein n=1 Tax=Sesamum radiatum TaxID=300843 RepID=A0AAW2SMI8_SESRA
MSMLAKQASRLVTKPNSLLSRVLQARYFLNLDFFHANLGYSLFFTWRNILAARQLLEVGCRWRVGDGSSIAIWHNRWVPRPYEFKPVMLRGNLSEDASVHALTCSSPRRWNLELLQQNFDKEDIDSIVAIPLARSLLTDRIIWHYSKYGRFLVISAYILA